MSESAWNSSIVPVRKPGGSLQMCVDYRRVNEVTVKERFLMNVVSDCVHKMQWKRVFTKLDLVRGYYQMPLEEGSRPVTAFSSGNCHCQFKSMSFGLANAPVAFQRAVNVVLAGLDRRKVTVLIDDILIVSETVEENIKLLEKVLEHLEEVGVKVKFEKWKPLTEWTGKNNCTQLRWDERMVGACERLKEKAARCVTLAFPDYSEDVGELELYADVRRTKIKKESVNARITRMIGDLSEFDFRLECVPGSKNVISRMQTWRVKGLVEVVTSGANELRVKLMSDVQKEVVYTEEQGGEEEMLHKLLLAVAELFGIEVFLYFGWDRPVEYRGRQTLGGMIDIARSENDLLSEEEIEEMQEKYLEIVIDCVSLPKAVRGHVGMIVMVDHMSKLAYVVPIKDKRFGTVVKMMGQVVMPMYVCKPVKMLSDNGP
ncbi:uncharacterized protein LOC135224805 [Macrobrachium nipponense]|uniref:uncharacterized protein LOC135224805 n=1 Tax=Macrobrachium nipponense TaxID=159736 RepID=UPI0030C7CDB9